MIPISKPFLDEKEANAAKDAVLSGWVTQGPKVKAFEVAFAGYTGAKFACAVSNCTAALHMALLTVGVKPGDVVITVSHSFISTANAVRYCGAEPVFVDIDGETLNMDVNRLEECLYNDCEMQDGVPYYKHVDSLSVGDSPLAFIKSISGAISPKIGRVAAIIVVHQIGIPCDILKISNLAKTLNIPLIEDAACAIGSEIENGGREKIGKPHGDIACFSFHPRKVITTGEGGMLTTNNQDYDSKFRLLRQHGMSVSDVVRHEAKDVVFEKYVVTAYNYRMTDIQASIGIEQLKKIEFIMDERLKNADKYKELFKANRYIKTIDIPKGIFTNWQSYPIIIAEHAGFTQTELMKHLYDKGISSRRGIMNAHQEHPYAAQRWNLPVSERIRGASVLIPFFNGISESNIEYIASTINNFCNSQYYSTTPGQRPGACKSSWGIYG